MQELLLALRVVLSLGIVVLVLWGLSRWLTKRQGTLAPRSVPVAVVGRAALGRNAGVTVVEVADRLLVLGVATTQVSLLAELPVDAAARPATATTLPTSPARTQAVRPASPKDVLMSTATTHDTAPARYAADSFGTPDAPVADAPAGPQEATDLDGLVVELFPAADTLDGQPVLSRRRRAEVERARRAHPAGGRFLLEVAEAAEEEDAQAYEAEGARVTPILSASGRATAGSVLDPATWQQTARAFKQFRKAL